MYASDIDWRIGVYKSEAIGNYFEIDLRGCGREEEIVLKFGEVFRGEASPILQTGKSLDALSDIMWDYYADSWRRYDTICIRGWRNAMIVAPEASQVIFNMIAYENIRSITWRLENAFDENEEETLESIDILDELKNGREIAFFMD